VTPKSASKKATGLELIEVPRSACRVSWPRWMFCFAATLFDQPLASSALSRIATIHPVNIAAEDIEDHVEIEVGPFGWSEQLGDIPTPELFGSRGQKFRLLVRR